MNDRQIKVERSIPVQSRVDLIDLADLLMYFEGLGIRVNTMSMLISTGLEMAKMVAFNNKVLPLTHGTVLEAHETLSRYGLYQPGMMKRGGTRKIQRARQFENIRLDGGDPEQSVPNEFKLVHSEQTIKAPEIDKIIEAGDKEVYQMPTPKAKTMEELTGEASGTKDTSEIMPTVGEIERESEQDEPTTTQTKVKKKDSRPRAKTNEEITADEERIAAKDKALAEADMSAPE